jgi:two-component system response regulator AtoC
VPELVAYFIDAFNLQFGRRARMLAGPMMQTLQKYHWPGNIRELANLMKRYVILGSEEAISTELAAHDSSNLDVQIPIDGNISLKKLTRQATHELERKIILKVLQANNWNRKRTARALSISYRALLYKMREANLPGGRVRGDGAPEMDA